MWRRLRTSPGAGTNYTDRPDPRREPAAHGIGRSRGGLSTKIHSLVDGKGRPLVILIGAGHANDSPMFGPLMASLSVPRHGPGRPRTRPDAVLADKAYSARAHRAHLRARRITAVIPEPSDQIRNRRRRGRIGGRPVDFDADLYRGRNVIERAFNRFKDWRAIATRYDKHAVNWRGGVCLAAILIWLRTT